MLEVGTTDPYNVFNTFNIGTPFNGTGIASILRSS
jgi:hypothetical protein